MGHQQLRNPPSTREWREIVSLTENGVGIEQLSKQTLRTCKKEFLAGKNDRGVKKVAYLLINLPSIAQSMDFATRLQHLGIFVSNEVTFFELLGALQGSIDHHVNQQGIRTDLDEMAQQAFIETLAKFVGAEQRPNLFDSETEGLRVTLMNYAKANEFSRLVQGFFARFLFRTLDYFLSRTLFTYCKVLDRFSFLKDEKDYRERLQEYCAKCSKILEKYAENWHFKHGPLNTKKRGNPPNYEPDNLAEVYGQRVVDGFLFKAMKKMVDAFTWVWVKDHA